jgi:hypothetical protein
MATVGAIMVAEVTTMDGIEAITTAGGIIITIGDDDGTRVTASAQTALSPSC